MYRAVYTAPPTGNEGIQLIYMPDRQAIRIEGWHNGRQGAIQPVDMPLGEFLEGLGITAADCERALGAMPATAQPMPRAASEAPPTDVTIPSSAPPRAA
jgi:hypothetical protein